MENSKLMTNVPVQSNEPGYMELIKDIQSKLDAMDTDIRKYYLQEVFEDIFVYSVRQDGQPARYFRQQWTRTNNELKFTGEIVQVTRKTDFIVTQCIQKLIAVKLQSLEQEPLIDPGQLEIPKPEPFVFPREYEEDQEQAAGGPLLPTTTKFDEEKEENK